MSEYKLPEPALHDGITLEKNGKYKSTEDGFTASQMQAAYQHGRADGQKWLPIESAPKDGTWVRLSGGSCIGDEGGNSTRQVTAQWTEELNGDIHPRYGRWQFAWYDGGYYGEYEDPTHWQPLPMPPQEQDK